VREFFLQDGGLIAVYPAYLRSTFMPWSPAGVHLIASAAPCDTVSSTSFAESSLKFARQVGRLETAAYASAK